MTRVVDPDGPGGCVIPSRRPLYPHHAIYTEQSRFSAQRNMAVRTESSRDKAIPDRVLGQPD
ncbi:hypothetical protein E5345_11720 [Propionibacterium sp. NM47_B9-13]|nr:hypothetical protein CP877_05075 [Cutibacterium modestum]TGY27635.1 hypothetical protein E5345_11720 [Propionibacterium sp. NM47_B9-13]